MIKITFLNVDSMEEIVAKKRLQRDGINIVMIAYVLKYQKQLKVQLKLHLIVFINGLVITIVMMKTTILNVKWMEVIVVKKTLQPDGITTVKVVNVLIFKRQHKHLMDQIVYFHNGLVMTTVT